VIVLACDPGSVRCGYAILRFTPRGALSYVDAGVITANPRDPLPARLAEIGRGLDEVIAEAMRERVGDELVVGAIEAGYAMGGGRGGSAIVVAEARGVAIRALQAAGIEVRKYAPSTVKKAVSGKGNASKELVATCVRALLGLRRTPGFDCADAISVGICRARDTT